MADESGAAPGLGGEDGGARAGGSGAEGGDGPIRDQTVSRRVGRLAVAVVGVVFIYYALPVGDLPSRWAAVFTVGGLLLGLAFLVYVAVRQVRVMAAAGPGDPRVRLDVLALVVIVVVPLFALTSYAVQQADDTQFADLETKTDALYFTLATLTTVGYGDVHATGQWARALVSVQIVVNVVFVAAVVSLARAEFRARASGRRRGPVGRAAGSVAEDVDER
jgi:voltage-gated potassium channel